MLRHRIGSQNPEENSEDGAADHPQNYISAVCWKSESPIMLAANSRGTVKVLELTLAELLQ
jgi:E3 ubiquitin-protein ligase RFWD2